MARKSGRSRRRRGISNTANRRLPTYRPVRPQIVRPLLSPVTFLQTIEDRRTFHPERAFRPARLFSGVRNVGFEPGRTGPGSSAHTVSPVVRFAVPERVVICHRRKTRREVIHARGVAGRRVRRPRRNWYSSISCKR